MQSRKKKNERKLTVSCIVNFSYGLESLHSSINGTQVSCKMMILILEVLVRSQLVFDLDLMYFTLRFTDYYSYSFLPDHFLQARRGIFVKSRVHLRSLLFKNYTCGVNTVSFLAPVPF